MDDTRDRIDRPLICIDPAGRSAGLLPADIILLTGAGRCSRSDIMAASTPQTVVAGPAECLQGLPLNQLVLRAGQTQTVLGVKVIVSAASGGMRYVVERPTP